MSDYLVWIGEEMEKRYGMDCYFWMEYIMNGGKIPEYLEVPNYLEVDE